MDEVLLDAAGVCVECGSSMLQMDYLRGEVVCAECGMVISELGLAHRHSDVTPAGAIHTEISPGDRDHNGRPISGSILAQVHRMRKWQGRMISYRSRHRNEHMALAEIDRTCRAMDLPPIARDRSRELYHRLLEEGKVMGRSLDCITAAVIYTACRDLSLPRTLNEVSMASDVDRRMIGRTHTRIVRELGLELAPPRPEDFLQRYGANLQLSEPTIAKAYEVLESADEDRILSGRDPSGLAAAALYIATGLTGQTRTQGEVEQYTGITQVTIRKRCKELRSNHSI